MKPFKWNLDKSQLLKRLRGISFEDVEKAILKNKLLGNIEHSNQQKYPGQKVFIVEFKNYAYYVPYVEENEFYFLKTIFPNRKATKNMLRKDKIYEKQKNEKNPRFRL